MQTDKLKSTIIIGIILVISIIFVVWLIPFNLKTAIEIYKESVQNSNTNVEGEMVIAVNLFASIGLLTIILSAYIPVVLCILNSGVSLIFSLKNRMSVNKTIRIINYVYDALLISIFVFSITKLILFIAHIG